MSRFYWDLNGRHVNLSMAERVEIIGGREIKDNCEVSVYFPKDEFRTSISRHQAEQLWMKPRLKGYGPPYIKVTKKLVRYRKGDLRAYLKKRTVEPKAEAAR